MQVFYTQIKFQMSYILVYCISLIFPSVESGGLMDKGKIAATII